MPADRRYTEAELHAIFERAAKRQEEARRAEAASHGGLTLAELQEIGEASGIDPAHVAAAAAELSAPKPEGEKRPPWPREVRAERRLPGPVSDETWEAMVEVLRRELNAPGVAGHVGRTREWTTMAGTGRQPEAPVSVTLRPDGDQTRLVVTQSWEQHARAPLIAGAVLSFMALLLGGIFAFTEPEALLLPALSAALALLFFALGPPTLRAFARRKEATFDRLLDRLELVARTEAQATPVFDFPPVPEPVEGAKGIEEEPPREGVEGAIKIEGIDGEPPDDATPAERRRARS